MSDQTEPFEKAAQLANVISIRRGEPAPTRVTYTVPEVASLLGISCATTYVLLRTGEIPARRIGSRWIIARRLFNAWLDEAGAVQ
ncbi:helix-turn-helix domain-containing protein [Microlunatus ginsengisoli]|uniref:Helix-turn-helix domain-containing protein n=1 Tax=Microlunatus ginsengisoli TaxID=363863 RepID=A0ABP6ZLA6_9ACTN